MIERNKLGPDFIGVGVQKSGTSSIFHYLSKRNCYFPKKELHFFTERKLITTTELNDYRNLFERSDKLISGEFTPNYYAQPFAIFNIAKYFPKVKLLISFRNPTARAYSAYLHAIRLGEIKPKESFYSIIDQSINGSSRPWVRGIVRFGLYANLFQNIVQLFPANQIFITSLERISNPAIQHGELNQLNRFLGLSDDPKPVLERANHSLGLLKKVSKINSLDDQTKTYLDNFYAKSNQRLMEMTRKGLFSF